MVDGGMAVMALTNTNSSGRRNPWSPLHRHDVVEAGEHLSGRPSGTPRPPYNLLSVRTSRTDRAGPLGVVVAADHRDFFISYTAADQAWAEWIAWQLEAAGYTTVLQAWDFAAGENFVVRMRDALEHADRTIAVLSPAYLASRYGIDEWTGAFLHDQTGRQRLLPILVEACELPRLLATLTHVDLSRMSREDARVRLLQAVRGGRRRPDQEPKFPGEQQAAASGEPPFPGRQPRISNLPVRNLVFTGRDEQLVAMRERLNAGTPAVLTQPQALHGLGGVGKTQLALEYAHRYAGDYDLIWWLAAEQPTAIPAQLVALARRLGISEAADQTETIQVLWDALRQRGRWLAVFDNAEDPSTLRPWWPPASGHMIITSRTPTWTGLAATIGVDVLPRAEAVAFLHRRRSMSDQEAATLAEVLGDLPLALEQAGAYLEVTGMPPADYVGLLRDRGPELFALGQATSEQTIATTWTVSLDRLRETPAAEDLTVLCAFLAPDDIPLKLLRDHSDQLPDSLAAAAQDRLGLWHAVAALRRYSLATVIAETLSMHRLVQAVVRHGLSVDQQRQWVTAAQRLLWAAFRTRSTDPDADPDAWPMYAQLLPHMLTVVDHVQPLGIELEITGWLLNRAGAYLYGRGRYMEAKALHERALAITEALADPDQRDSATLNYLGLALRRLGDLPAARAYHERALAIRDAQLGPNHPSTATSLTNLATVLRDQGDLPAARAHQQRALAIREARLGPDHPHTAHSLNNLAKVLADQGDLDGARALHERALGIYMRRLGTDHPDTARSLTNLALVLHAQGDLKGARVLHERALAVREASLGPSHPDTATSLTNLAGVLLAQDDLHNAQTLYERALAIREASLGSDHLRTALSVSLLAKVLHAQNDLPACRSLHERALATYEARLGPDHPSTLKSRRELEQVTAELADQQRHGMAR